MTRKSSHTCLMTMLFVCVGLGVKCFIPTNLSHSDFPLCSFISFFLFCVHNRAVTIPKNSIGTAERSSIIAIVGIARSSSASMLGNTRQHVDKCFICFLPTIIKFPRILKFLLSIKKELKSCKIEKIA
jgi:hypothetical protein